MIPIQTSLTQLLGKQFSLGHVEKRSNSVTLGIKTPIVAAAMAGASGGNALKIFLSA